MKMEKKQLRSMVKKRLSQMTDQEYQERSAQAAKKLFNHSAWKEANTVGITVSRQREVDTIHIIEQAWKQEKNTTVPRCMVEDNRLDFRLFTSFEQLEVVYMDLKEPSLLKTKAVSPHEVDLLIVPGLLFDKNGYRIGYGGGYYDRYLSTYTNKTIALAFECQIIDTLPREPFDLPVQEIITEEKIYKIKC
ncbi:5-formyltetrahydrofolate cyclo-ligase [Bacillus taeanensis]|nr:5-formyltetrahydrofolate cyclo-ligase [Bacillus taeanensis]